MYMHVRGHMTGVGVLHTFQKASVPIFPELENFQPCCFKHPKVNHDFTQWNASQEKEREREKKLSRLD